MQTGKSKTKKYEFQNWLSHAKRKDNYFDFWSDYRGYDDFDKIEEHLKKSKLPYQLKETLKLLKHKLGRELSGVGADLGAGPLWEVPHLFKLGNIKKIYCVDYSYPLLVEIGSEVLSRYKVPSERVVLALGSFYKLKIPRKSVDFVFLSQAFHHAGNPNALLSEIKRVLKPEGVVIIIGECITEIAEVNLKTYVKYMAKILLSLTVPKNLQNKIIKRSYSIKDFNLKNFPRILFSFFFFCLFHRNMVSPSELFPPDSSAGDHYYSYDQYCKMFSAHKLEIIGHIKDIFSGLCFFQAFVLINK